ncbi:FAD-binding domain-containing protein [Mytilinidion resinicola]|uniref:FAD-binding domain-containing protein n=1 Tax=Mytilinidion resinicola TaxID=574789 RepID=A0A6A6Z3H3_9PEZI|nr:FAD-binding domain-containing protein [Mytilinidion resinicola]KAF2815570.1 FAD-binding domain-containing protein [Mytilinidion resinicola]
MTVWTRPSAPPSASHCEYERLRRSYINADIREAYPREIHLVNSTFEVQNAIRSAVNSNSKIGVRSGGHTFSNPSLIHDGILVDTTKLHCKVEYDPVTHYICYGPAVRVAEASELLQKLGRFFPHGHAPTVALGGFTLAGGQGMFMPTWGPTVGDWIVRMEIVTPDGKVKTASMTENADLFWAARGSGQAFFGVVTRIWARTIPSRRMFMRMILFEDKDNIENLLQWALETSRIIPRWGTETAMTTGYSEMHSPTHKTDSIPSPPTLHFGVCSTAYVDTLEEARSLLSAWDRIPAPLHGSIIDAGSVAEMSWAAYFELQELVTPSGPRNNWQINSFLNDPEVPLERLVKAVKPAMTELPTRTSLGCIYCCHSYPDDNDHLCALPQQYYISTFTHWKEKSLEPKIYEPMADIYAKLYPLGVGMYIADYNPFDERQANVKVWTDKGLQRFMEIRAKYDPQELFPGFIPFVRRVKQVGIKL